MGNYTLTEADVEAINRLLKNAHKMGPEFISVIEMNVLNGKLVDFEVAVSDKGFKASLPIAFSSGNKTIADAINEVFGV